MLMLSIATALSVTAAVQAGSAGTRSVDGARLIRQLGELAEFGRNAQGGVSRVAFSQADVDGRAYVAGLMRAAGLDVSIDAAGNLLGTRAGSEELPPIMIGSHIDSVPMGGNYDGQVGSMAAVEVAQTLADRPLRHPLEVVIFSNEENGKTGSRAMAGEVEERELRLPSHTGRPIGLGLKRIGGDPTRLDSVRRRRGDVAAFLELHIEQGATLDRDGVPIGVVEGIVGIRRWNVRFDGFANHAGTTPMRQRRDALVAAARFVDAVHRVATDTEGSQVATVGRIRAEPGAPNVIPGAAELSLEIRDLSMAKIDRVFEAIAAKGEAIATATGTAFSAEAYYLSGAAPTDERIRKAIEHAADSLELDHRRMPSGAGHDAQSIARFAPIGMIFVPSKDGISHSPSELSEPADIVRGANVLLRTLLRLDAADW